VVEPYLAAERLELDDLELSGSGGGRFLRVVVDGDDLGVDRLADVSRGISRLLDEETDLRDSYQLEVSSPGLERTLRRPAHYSKAVGREVAVKVRQGDESRTLRGVVTGSGEESFEMQTDDGTVGIPYHDVLTAKTVFRWERGPKPGH